MGKTYQAIQQQFNNEEGNPSKKRRVGNALFTLSPLKSIQDLPQELLAEILKMTNLTLGEFLKLGLVSKQWHTLTHRQELLKSVLAQLSNEKIHRLFEKTVLRFKEILAIKNIKSKDEDGYQKKISNFYSATLPELQKNLEVLLLDNRITIDTKFTDDQQTLCHFVVNLNLSEMIPWLQKKDADLNATDKDGYTPLHIAFMTLRTEDGYVKLEAARELLKYNIAINERDEKGKTPLHWLATFDSINELNAASIEDFKKFIYELLKKGADFQAKESYTLFTPWRLAAQLNHLEINYWLNKCTQKQIKKQQQQQKAVLAEELDTADLLTGIKLNF